MLDIKFIRENPKVVEEGSRKKGVEIDIELLLSLDKQKREFLQKIEEFRAQKNKANEDIKKANKEEKESIIKKMRDIGKESEKFEEKLKEIEKELNKELRKIPNLPLEEVPLGQSEKDNKVLRREGQIREFDFPVKDYLELAEKMDLIDIKRAAKVSGTRFGIIKKEAAYLHFALISLALEITQKYGFVPLLPPVMIRPEMMEGMGYVERGGDEIYHLEKDNLYLIGTSEQIIGPMHSGEIFNEKELPRRYVGYSSCFRREAGSHGKDTKGILRVHQFEKVEMFSFTTPEKSKEEHELLLSIEEELMQALEIPYQVVDICTADLGDPAAKKYDIEAWMPGQNQYRETHSTSNCTDFQSRRLNIRYKGKEGVRFTHMLNGTALAIGRIIISIMENHQQADGSIVIPSALRKYLPFKEIK